ncbi:MAG: hypothetical protein K8T25_02810 [Planctomycetia bacterium]|nr:hypothetical protein [Planctomycetia bacterium]
MSDPSTTHVRLDFDRLVREYLDNLQVNLRGFKAAESHGFLDAWVPHDDPTENLIELIQLAREAGYEQLTVAMSQATAGAIDLAQVKTTLGASPRSGMPDGMADGGEWEFSLDALKDAARPAPTVETPATAMPERPASTDRPEPGAAAGQVASTATSRDSIHPCYRDALSKVLTDVQHERQPEAAAGQEHVTVQLGDWELSASVDTKNTVVKQAGFAGTGTAIERGLLEMLCHTIEGRPIQEAADHATIAIEHALRDKKAPPPVVGVVTPENADPAFQLPQQIVRKLLSEYRTRTGYSATRNFFDRPASPTWIKLSPEERCEAIAAVLPKGGDEADVKLVRMDGLKRVVVGFTSELTSHQKQVVLAQLEAALRERVEPSLQVMAQIRADANILRMPEQKK